MIRSAAAGVCLSLMISGVLSLSVDSRETAAPQRAVRRSLALCAGEQQYVDQRKQLVEEALHRLLINCSEDSVPHIVLLASGGGQRAAVSLVGSLYQMAQDGLLDSLLYLGGVSGSTWSMASLYSDPEWSWNMDRAQSRLSGDGVELQDALGWLNKTAAEDGFSLSDVWGVLTSAGIMKQMDERRLSDEANRNASNPYPIYSAVEKHCYSHGPIEAKWFEVSPHEAGFTELDLFVNTSLLGSKFQMGDLLEKKPEMDMIKLQGVFGCALAHEELVVEFVPDWLRVGDSVNVPAQEYLRVYNTLHKLIGLTRMTVKDPAGLTQLDKLQKRLQDQVSRNESALLESKSLEEREALFQRWGLDLVTTVTTWTESLEDGPFKALVSMLTKQVIPLILKWEWGTTENFLYKYQDSTVPACLLMEERFQLVDAGALINVGYPPFLGDKRDIDLIIAPEYSAGDMFETLTLARDYAAKVKKPFPVIDDRILEDRDWPKDCYVFDGKENEPTIIYMPLFNRHNCKDAKQFTENMDKFSTFQRPFSQDMVESLLATAKTNMKNHRETLLREINKAVLRRQNKRKS
ncbi:cytosolic phospholipase A2 gamma-like [Salarias fasciatus]|uniref:Cytosolic phospholipase A2 gamma-like n=1 Tax=Salarias fasciatus TaxID=181472 RepID=A0A672G375_SALFA|nr:cytosolic phospholipase A2 gamma-like [Salarias fasciatus]